MAKKEHASRRMKFDDLQTGLVKDSFFGYWYFQYCLITGLYMLEKWERRVFDTFVLILVASLLGGLYTLSCFL